MKSNMNLLSDLDLVKMAQEGSTTASEFILRKYKALVKSKASNYFVAGGDHDDVIQEGMIGLYKAIRDFDPKKNNSFLPFANLCIKRQIISAVNSANRQKHRVLNDSYSLDDQDFAWDGQDFLSVEDKGFSPEKVTILKDTMNKINSKDTGFFSYRETKVWNLILEGQNVQQICKTLSMDSKSVYNTIGRIRAKLLRVIEN